MCIVCEAEALVGKYVRDKVDSGVSLPADGKVVSALISGTWFDPVLTLSVETHQFGMPPFTVVREPSEVVVQAIH